MIRAALICMVLLAASTGMTRAQSPNDAMFTSETLKTASGEAIYRHICQGCHMPDAKGATGAGTYPSLTNNPRLVSAQYMAATILFGRHDMPSFVTKSGQDGDFFGATMLSDAQIADVINYVRTHFGNTYSDRITAEDVAAMHPHDASQATKP